MSKYCMGCMEQYEDEFDVCPYCGFVEGTMPAEALHIEPGSILAGRYIVGRVIGFGGFGVTYIGFDALLEHKVAIKEYLPSEFSTRMIGQTQITVFNGDKKEQFEDGMNKFIDEAKKLAKFQNAPGIVKIYDSFAENNTAYIIMEYLKGETLSAYLDREKTVSPEKAVELLTPVIESLEAVHAEGIIHRDIAPDNIFCTENGDVKLIDFGAARFATTTHSRSLTVIIKAGYSPEEQYRSRSDQGPYTDVYAIGAVFYRMITGAVPPDAMERRAFFEGKHKDILVPIEKKSPCEISANTANAIMNALNVRIEDRTPDMATLLSELNSDGRVQRRVGKIKKIDIFRWPLWLKLSSACAACLVITLTALFALGVIGFDSNLKNEIVIPDDMTRVPSVVNTGSEDAFGRIESLSLQYKIAGKEYSDIVPADVVLSQDLSAGSVVMLNSVVSIKISSGAKAAEIPDLTGFTLEEAQKYLVACGFEVSSVQSYDNAVCENCVIAQSFVAGTMAEIGETVTLTVSMGYSPDYSVDTEEMIILPELTGKTYQEALELAAESGFTVYAESRMTSAEAEKDTVITQSIDSGTRIKKGNSVGLVVSLGEKVFKMPDLLYQEEEIAKTALAVMSVPTEIRYEASDEVAAGLVALQSVDAGTVLDAGAKVILTVSTGSAAVKMPKVTGLEASAASEKLSALGLIVTLSYVHSEEAETGAVLEQSVTEGDEVRKGDTLTLTVATSAEVETVPSVIGKTEAQAKAELEALGFKVTASYSFSPDKETGTVTDQLPEAGVGKEKGYNVVITVNNGDNNVIIPSVSGMTESKATAALKAVGFTVSCTYEYSGSAEKGKVISQAPSANASAAYGSKISLVISKGQTPISVPNLVNMTEADAKAALSALSLKCSVKTAYSNTVAAGKVISQNPASGSALYKNDVTEITVSLGKATTPVTSVTLSQTSVTLTAGQTVQLSASVSPSNATDKSVVWTTGNSSVADVSANGLVTAKSSGTVTITAGAVSGSASAVCTFTVNPAAPPTVSVTFDANGGSCSTGSKTVDKGSAYGELPAAWRDYYSFNGWFTSASGGSRVSSGDAAGSSVTLYAQWTENALSDWVLASSVPAGAQIVNTQWRYTLTTYKTSTSSSMSGFTANGTEVQYGNWVDQGWTKTPQTKSETLQITDTKTVTDTEAYTQYKYYRYKLKGGTRIHFCVTKATELYGGTWEEQNSGWLNSPIAPTGTTGLCSCGKANCYCTGNGGKCTFYGSTPNQYYKEETQTIPAVTHTEWYYQTRTATTVYKFTKTENLTSDTQVSASNNVTNNNGTTITNVQQYVRYRAK